MLEPWNIFNRIKNRAYKTYGADIDYCIDYDEREKTLYLYLQESTSELDWHINFSFWPHKTSQDENGRAVIFHGGYYNAWITAEGKILAELTAKIANLEYEYKQISQFIITGWSYGGAISLIAAYSTNKYLNMKADVVTFGAPRILKGKKSIDAMKDYVSSVSQYANYNDLVTKVIPWKPWTHLNEVPCGNEKFSFWKLFNPKKYHCQYGDNTIYK